jgi:hypothetical protein
MKVKGQSDFEGRFFIMENLDKNLGRAVRIGLKLAESLLGLLAPVAIYFVWSSRLQKVIRSTSEAMVSGWNRASTQVNPRLLCV